MNLRKYEIEPKPELPQFEIEIEDDEEDEAPRDAICRVCGEVGPANELCEPIFMQ